MFYYIAFNTKINKTLCFVFTRVCSRGLYAPIGARGLAHPQREWKKSHNRFSCAEGTNLYVKVLCLVIVTVNVSKYMPQKCQIWQICGYRVCFFQALNTPKLVFSRGPRWGSLRRSPDPLVGWGGGHPLPIPFSIDAFGVSISAPRLLVSK